MLEKLQLITLMLITDVKTRRDEKGATAVEYGLMVALIAVAIAATVGALGGALDGLFGDVQDELPAVPAGGEGGE